jgi:hypothetical protein
MALQLLLCSIHVLFAPGMQAVGAAMPDGLLKKVVGWAKRKQRPRSCTNNIFLAFLAVNFIQIL